MYLSLSCTLAETTTEGNELQITCFSRTVVGQFSLKPGTLTYMVPVDVLPVFSVRITFSVKEIYRTSCPKN